MLPYLFVATALYISRASSRHGSISTYPWRFFLSTGLVGVIRTFQVIGAADILSRGALAVSLPQERRLKSGVAPAAWRAAALALRFFT
jgi:hypothetical protein